MKYSKTCECCGHLQAAYTHRMNRNLVSALDKLVKFYKDSGRRANISKDLDLTFNQRNNFQKLQYFKLVHRDANGWVPTSYGVSFIEGKISCADTVASFNNQTLEPGHEAWETHSKKIKMVMAGDYMDVTYKQPEEYKEEKRQTLFEL